MTADERAYQIVCDVFGSESGWEHVTRMVADAIREAVAAERERCARVAETTLAFVGDFGEPNRTRFAVENMRRLADRIAARIREGT